MADKRSGGAADLYFGFSSETEKPGNRSASGQQRASNEMASVTHLAAWRAAKAAVATWRAPNEVCVAGRWVGHERAHRR